MLKLLIVGFCQLISETDWIILIGFIKKTLPGKCPVKEISVRLRVTHFKPDTQILLKWTLSSNFFL